MENFVEMFVCLRLRVTVPLYNSSACDARRSCRRSSSPLDSSVPLSAAAASLTLFICSAMLSSVLFHKYGVSYLGGPYFTITCANKPRLNSDGPGGRFGGNWFNPIRLR